jgi:hypothetical protein
MKRIVAAIGALAMLFILWSCAGFPEPAGEGTSLVIGSLVIDYPDGFYNQPARKFDTDVKITVKNTTQERKFDLFTSRGYFYFQSNGTDAYVLESYNLPNIVIGDTRYSGLGSTIGMEIATTPGKVIYLGHIVITLAAPRVAQLSGRESMYHFKTSASWDWDKDELRQFITQRQADSPWLQMEILEYGKKK